MTPFTFNTTRSIRMGDGLLDQLGDMARATCGDSVLLVTDPGMMATGIVDRALAAIEAAGVAVTVFSDVKADPPEAVILQAVAAAKGMDGVIGLGGGSSIDVAKLAALLACSGETLADCYGVGMAKGPRLPLIAVPTTSGTGSEVTPISIVTTGASEKMGVVSPLIIPDVALLDPELTRDLLGTCHGCHRHRCHGPRHRKLCKCLAEQQPGQPRAGGRGVAPDGRRAGARSERAA